MNAPAFPHSGHRIVRGVWRDIDHEKSTKCNVQRWHLNECANTPSRSASWTPPLVSTSGSRSLVFIITVDVRSPFGSARSNGCPSSVMADSSHALAGRFMGSVGVTGPRDVVRFTLTAGSDISGCSSAGSMEVITGKAMLRLGERCEMHEVGRRQLVPR